MLNIDIPGFGHLNLKHLVLDYNGTLAFDGRVLLGIRKKLVEIARNLEIHVLTADTFGTAANQLKGFPVRLVVLGETSQAGAKLDYVAKLGAENVAAIGNGRNDALMLESAALGIAIIQREGVASETLHAADIGVGSVVDALNLLIAPRRLVATLRA